jgi:hypothetical protein
LSLTIVSLSQSEPSVSAIEGKNKTFPVGIHARTPPYRGTMR